ncbi:MAG: ABC transporter permease subunit [Dehalococcoidales bacterium]|nr:ABC transporter permease subunit [Dehalococcoidales bacterium]
MWFTSVYLKTLRDFRVGILGWGLGVGLLMVAVLSAFPSLVETPEARDALVGLAGSFSWIAEPVAIDTPGGYATFKYGFTILVIVLWPLLVGSRMLRGEEESGSLDALLSLPRSRARVALEKLAAMWTALLAMGLLIGLLAFAGGSSAGADFGLGGGLLFGLNLALIAGMFGAVALLLSQFTQASATAGATGGLLLLSIVVDMVHRVVSNTEWLSRLSPVYYYNLSKPLVTSYGYNSGAMLVLLGVGILLSAWALVLFVRRDVGGTAAIPAWLRLPQRAVRPGEALPVNAWSLRSIYTRSLATIAMPTFWWTLIIAGFAGWMVIIVKQTEEKLAVLREGSPLLSEVIAKVGGGDATTNASLLSFLFVFLPLLLMAFAVTQASRWAADEENGRQELVLATPQPRSTVILARFGALATSMVVVGATTLAATALSSAVTGLKLDQGNLAAAALGMIPLGLLVGALGYLFSGWLRTAVDTGLLSFLLLIWFFISFIGPELNWPDGALRLSAFYYYGTPLLNGLPLLSTLGTLAVTAVALALASVRFARKDIGR